MSHVVRVTLVPNEESRRRFFEQYPSMQSQFEKSYSDCFVRESYSYESDEFRRNVSYRAYQKVKFYDHLCLMPRREIHSKVHGKRDPYWFAYNVVPCHVFVHAGDELLLSCRLSFGRYKVGIHSVCVPKSERGLGHCKTYMPIIVEYVRRNHLQDVVYIECLATNQMACKCYERIFGPALSSRIFRDTKMHYYELTVEPSRGARKVPSSLRTIHGAEFEKN